MSIQLFNNNFVPKYENGKWIWNEISKKFEFKPNRNKQNSSIVRDPTTSVVFKNNITQIEEMTFIRKFQRFSKSRDSDVIILQDIKDLVLFLASFDRLPKNFIDFFHANTTDEFLSDLIIYFAYFLKLWEFLLIGRDEASCESKQNPRNADTERIESLLSEYLSQYRLMLARDYSKLLLGENDSSPFHHMKNKMNTSYSEKDRNLFETLLSFSIEIVWIAMHRKKYKIIG